MTHTFDKLTLTLANLFIDKAMQIAYKLQKQDGVNKCSNKRGEIKRLRGNFDSALLDQHKPSK